MSTLNIILTHQNKRQVLEMTNWWRNRLGISDLLLAYGGAFENYGEIEGANKVYAGNQRLRTKEHQRECQSYQSVFKAASESNHIDCPNHIHLAEYDQIPLHGAINEHQVEFLKSQKADLIGYRVQRIDRTNSPHYLYHAANPEFHRFIESISTRKDTSAVFSMLGFGSVWKTVAFRAVARIVEPLPIYLEVFMPTVAHHLGFRVRNISSSTWIANPKGSVPNSKDMAPDAPWFAHPVKDQWLTTTT